MGKPPESRRIYQQHTGRGNAVELLESMRIGDLSVSCPNQWKHSGNPDKAVFKSRENHGKKKNIKDIDTYYETSWNMIETWNI